MTETLGLSFGFIALFVSVFLISYGLALASKRAKKQLSPSVGSSLRIRAESGVYRARFLGEDAGGWMISAPIKRDSFVPLRIGEALIVEGSFSGGMLTFRTVVLDRISNDHSFKVAKPPEVFASDRRSEPRVEIHDEIAIQGEMGTLIDVSEHGAKLKPMQALKRGERIWMELPWRGEPAYAWVLEHEASGTRVRFEEPVVLPPAR